MLRTSLPNALRALGRFDEATAAQQRLSNITTTPASSQIATPSSWRLDPAIEAVIAERERRERIRERNAFVLLTKLEREP